jgi:hypothetical protein
MKVGQRSRTLFTLYIYTVAALNVLHKALSRIELSKGL